MADQPLDPQTEARVRRLLAEARHDEPVPPEVAARLDAVLADLAAEPAARRRVVRLADRRRRAGALLVAAAAVVVAGIGIDQALRGAQGGGAPTSAEAPQPADSAAGLGEGASTGSQPSNEPSNEPRDEPTEPGRAPRGASVAMPPWSRHALPVRPRHFSLDVRAAKLAPTQLADGATTDSATTNGYLAQAGRLPGCRSRGWGAGRYVPVTYGRLPGYLVFRKPAGDTQVADLFLCGARTAVRSVTLPRP